MEHRVEGMDVAYQYDVSWNSDGVVSSRPTKYQELHRYQLQTI